MLIVQPPPFVITEYILRQYLYEQPLPQPNIYTCGETLPPRETVHRIDKKKSEEEERGVLEARRTQKHVCKPLGCLSAEEFVLLHTARVRES